MIWRRGTGEGDVSHPQLQIAEHRCENGLLVLMLEAETAPVVCVSVWFRAGSRHDPSGGSGAAHLLEHMMFKGTPQYPKGEYDRILHALGGINNASTWLDRTNYYVLIGNDRYTTALELEADRMRGARLDANDLEDERGVVLNELDSGQDEPASALVDQLVAMAFLKHPYRRPVIGWRADVEAISQDELSGFYDRYYQPGNAFLVVVGQFRREEMIAAIERTFGTIPPGPDGIASPAREAPQRGERRFELRKAGEQELWAAAYRTPQRADEDALLMDVLAQVLGHGRTSRLYKALVDSGLAVHVSAENQSMPADPYLFFLDVEPAQGVEIARIEEVVDAETARLCREPIREEELRRARKRARVDFTSRRDSVSALAFLIGELEVSTGWGYLQGYLDRLEQVTPEQVKDAAARHLVRDRRTVGHFRPTDGGEEGAP
jgi:zinc protease